MILAGLFVLFGRISVDTLAVAASAIINMFYGIFDLLRTGQLGPDTLIGVIRANPDVVKPLINLSNPDDAGLKLVGTALFVMIAYIGFKFAVQKAGGKDTPHRASVWLRGRRGAGLSMPDFCNRSAYRAPAADRH